jgi:hypothetical protein
MSTYITLAAGAIFLTVVVGIIIPDGKLNKFISFIMRLICIFVLIQPITQIFEISDAEETYVNYDYICEVYSRSQSRMLEDLIYDNFEVECECTINISYDGEQIIQSDVNVVLPANTINEQTKTEIYAYLQELGYIDINVNEKGS